MNVLVTGGVGFVGSHVVDALVEQGHRVTVVDDLSSGLLRNVHEGAILERVDVRDADVVDAVVRRGRPGAVMAMVAAVNVGRSVRANTLALDAPNGTYNTGTSILELASPCCSAFGHAVDVEMQPGRTDEVRKSVLDASHAGRVPGWVLRRGLEDGLRSTLDWYRDMVEGEGHA